MLYARRGRKSGPSCGNVLGSQQQGGNQGKVRDEGLNAVRVEGWQKKMSQPCKASEAQRLDDMSITWFGKACTTF